jgi:poly(3-hydroxybutyrate) depolymerase
MVVHATGDRIINVATASRVQESWAKSFPVEAAKPSWSKSSKTNGTSWEHRRYTDGSGNTALETVLLDHDEHGWYGGRDGKYGFSNAPDVSAMIWRFFASNPLTSAAETRGILRFFRSSRAA